MALYKVVEFTHLDDIMTFDFNDEYRLMQMMGDSFMSGWELVSTKALNDDGTHRYLVLLAR